MYCAISNALEQCKAEGMVNVFQTLKRLRMQKPGAISTLVIIISTIVNTIIIMLLLLNLQEQYKAVFDVINAFFHNTCTHFQQKENQKNLATLCVLM